MKMSRIQTNTTEYFSFRANENIKRYGHTDEEINFILSKPEIYRVDDKEEYSRNEGSQLWD